MAGHDPKDSTSAPLPVPDFAAAARNPDIKGLKVGIPKEYRVDGTSPEIEALWDKGIEMMKAAGAVVGRGLAAAHQVRAAGLLHRGAGRVLVEPRAL